MIWQNDYDLASEQSTLMGCLEHLPKIVKMFGQEFAAPLQQRDL
jgi:hypothetical protein